MVTMTTMMTKYDMIVKMSAIHHDGQMMTKTPVSSCWDDMGDKDEEYEVRLKQGWGKHEDEDDFDNYEDGEKQDDNKQGHWPQKFPAKLT